MDGETLQRRIYSGYAKAALRIGQLYSQYRPSGATNPLATIRGSLYASFNAEDMTYARPNKYGKPTWYAVMDGSLTQPGDYLQGPGGTFFIAAQQQALPILAVECNRTIRMARMIAPTAAGVVGYGGIVEAQETDILTGWPCSILIGGRSDKAGDLPAGVKSAGWVALLPPSVPVTIMAGDILHDDLSRRYAVYSAELTDLGWRLNVNEVHA